MKTSRLKILFIAFTVLFWGLNPLSEASQITVKVTGVGFIVSGDIATARDQAIRDAQVRALEEALGVEVDARVALHKTLLIDSTVVTRTKGVVRKHKILSEGSDDNGLYWVTLEALVDTVAMADELVRLAGEKKVLLIRGGDRPDKGNDDALLLELAKAFSEAGFKLSQTSIPEMDFLILDSISIKALARKTNNDIVISLKIDSAEPQCATDNFCACQLSGFIRLYEGKAGVLLADERIDGVRGFGNTRDFAKKDALTRGANVLVEGLMSSLFFPQEKELRVIVRNIPDYDSYRALQRTIATFRWVREVEEDSVGYHAVKTVFIVRFVQDLDIFAGMLDKIGRYTFIGRNGTVFTLKYRK